MAFIALSEQKKGGEASYFKKKKKGVDSKAIKH